MADQDQTKLTAAPAPEAQLTIGMLVASLGDRYNTMLVQGAAEFAAAQGVNLVVYLMDGPNRAGKDDVGSEPCLDAYGIVNTDACDGLILTGALAYRDERGLERLNAFRARHAALPMVGISLWLDDMPTVVPDSYAGLREAVEHVINDHGYTRIGFVSGPEDSVEAQERYRAYRDVLAERGIEPDPTWIVGGDFSREGGVHAARTLVNRGLFPKHGLDLGGVSPTSDPVEGGEAHEGSLPLDAVICASDDTAIGFMEVLEDEGLRVPDDVALLGFDDIQISRRLPVPLSTVRQPVRQIGYQAAANLWSRLRREETLPDERSQTVVPTHFVQRRSCGCPPSLLRLVDVIEAKAAHDADADLEGAILPDSLADMYETFHQDLEQIFINAVRSGPSGIAAAPSQTPAMVNQTEVVDLVRALWEDLTSGDEMAGGQGVWRAGSFLRLLTDLLQRAVRFYGENLLGWQRGISALRHRLRALFKADQSLWLRASDLLQQARALVSDAQMRGFAYRQTWVDRRLATLQDFSAQAMNLMAIEGLQPMMEHLLPDLDISACHVLIYASTGSTTAAYRLLSYHSGHVNLYGRDVLRPPDQLLSETLAEEMRASHPTAGGARVQVVMALQVGDQHPGLVHFVGGVDDGGVYQRLRQILSGVVFRSQLSETQRARAARLAAAADVSSAATSITELAQLLPEAVTLIKDRFDLYYAGLFLVDDPGRWAVLVAGTGDAGREMLAHDHKLAVGGQSMIGMCVATGKPRIVFDPDAEVTRSSNPLLPETQSELALPLISHGRVIGAMTIQDVRPNAFVEEDITTLQTMANQLANAIQNARLLEQMELTVHDLQRATQDYTAEAWQQFVRSRSQSLGYRYHLLDVEPVDEPYPEAREALVHGKPVISSLASSVGHADGRDGVASSSDGAPGPQAGLGVPIRLRNQILGVLNLRFEEGNVPQDTVQMIEQIADRLAVSLESARLLEASQRTAQREHLIADVSSRIRQTLEVDEVLRTSVREIRNALDLFKVSVRLAPRSEMVDAAAMRTPAAGSPAGDDCEAHQGADAPERLEDGQDGR